MARLGGKLLAALGDLQIPVAPFAQKNLPILLDTHVVEEQDHLEVPPF
jgi:hypothetical protein